MKIINRLEENNLNEIKRYYNLAKTKLFPLMRSLTGEGVRTTLKIIHKEFSKLKNCFFYSDINDALKDTDLIILHTEWDEFKTINFKKLNKNKNFKVYDLRNLYNFEEMAKQKIKYFSIGRPAIY